VALRIAFTVASARYSMIFLPHSTVFSSGANSTPLIENFLAACRCFARISEGSTAANVALTAKLSWNPSTGGTPSATQFGLDLSTALMGSTSTDYTILVKASELVVHGSWSQMPVDRAGRDALADALSSFLRGESSGVAFAAEVRRLALATKSEPSNGSTKDDFLEELLAGYTTCGFNTWPISEKEWNGLKRQLAFLKSDLEMRSWREQSDEFELRRFARWHTFGLLVTFGLAYLTSWFVIVAFSVISFLRFQVVMQRSHSNDEEQRSRWQAFYPFADENEWLAHQHLLDPYDFPPYDPSRFHVQRSKLFSILFAMSRIGSFVCIVAMFTVLAIGSILIWPLWLVMMSVCSFLPVGTSTHSSTH
jgi:hypothetical protein